MIFNLLHMISAGGVYRRVVGSLYLAVRKTVPQTMLAVRILPNYQLQITNYSGQLPAAFAA